MWGDVKKNSKAMKVYYASQIGMLHIEADEEGLTGLRPVVGAAKEDRCGEYESVGQDHAWDSETAVATGGKEEGAQRWIETVIRWLDHYFAGERPTVAPPLHPRGTAFQQKVWEELTTLPYGTTTTYGALAKRIGKVMGKQMSAQAVGQAVRHNPIAIIIPCHRVIGSDGKMTGYAHGISNKKRLLEIEGMRVEEGKIINP